MIYVWLLLTCVDASVLMLVRCVQALRPLVTSPVGLCSAVEANKNSLARHISKPPSPGLIKRQDTTN